MEQFNLFDASDIAGYDAWIKVWSTWPKREVFAHPEYVKLFARECDRAICAVQESPEGMILLPMILRPLSAEEWGGEKNEYYDITSPYGFGGPYVTGRHDMGKFWNLLTHWAIESGVISAFFRLSPYAADITGFVDSVDSSGGNVIRSLTEGREAIWKDIENGVRTKVRRAEKNGVTVLFDECGESLPDFIRLYYRTMQRCNAKQQYYFPMEFFRNIITQLSGQFFLSHALYQGRVISSNLVLVSREFIYPFLGGSDETFFNLNSNKLLDMQNFYWGIEHGKKCCILGGGYDGYDGVFKYKEAFAPSGVVPFLLGKHIFDHGVYQTMCGKRKKFEVERGQLWAGAGTYFPAYRATIIDQYSERRAVAGGTK